MGGCVCWGWEGAKRGRQIKVNRERGREKERGTGGRGVNAVQIPDWQKLAAPRGEEKGERRGNDIKWVGHALNSYTCCLHFSQINMAPRFRKLSLTGSLSLCPPPTPFPLPPSFRILSSSSSSSSSSYSFPSVSILQDPKISVLTLRAVTALTLRNPRMLLSKILQSKR